MFFDLQGEENMSQIVGILYAAVKENSQRLKTITKGMEQEEVDYKGPNNNGNSTAQLIRHIIFVDLNWVYRIRGEQLPKSYNDKFGPMLDQDNNLPMVKGYSLETLLSEYDAVLMMLNETCTLLTDDDLDEIVTFGLENEKQSTIRWGLWHMADHNRYHQAHINQLRKWYDLSTKKLC
ncbi:DinB family protein [Metabacillus litoralis]|uniref:DinB family protein n=1 Tax=Metabacillus litoralis TaxID=152268 RepID=UPI001CFDD842|nr:DinB family protein [Metabacillus litoralis]